MAIYTPKVLLTIHIETGKYEIRTIEFKKLVTLKELHPDWTFKTEEEANKIVKSIKVQKTIRKPIVSTQVLCLNEDSYNYYRSEDGCPICASYKERSSWKTKNRKERLEFNLGITAESIARSRVIDWSYKILE